MIEGEIGGSLLLPQGKRPITGGKLARSTVRSTTSFIFLFSRSLVEAIGVHVSRM